MSDKFYTDEVTADLVRVYEAAVANGYEAGVEAGKAWATEHGVTWPSARAKLVREKVYVSKETVSAGKRVPKAELISELARFAGVDEDVLGSLEKATGPALKVLVEAFEAMEVAEAVEEAAEAA